MTRADTFDRLHDAKADPWSVDSWYEMRKRAVTLAALPRPRYRLGFEPGCSIGALSEAIAPRCDALVAADTSAIALERARERLAHLSHVTVVQLEIPGSWIETRPDLLLLSEVAYFLTPEELEQLVDRARTTVPPGGDVVLVNWTGPIEGFSGLDATRIHDRFRAADGLRTVVLHEEPEFVLEVFRR